MSFHWESATPISSIHWTSGDVSNGSNLRSVDRYHERQLYGNQSGAAEGSNGSAQ
jgi:hypothetical protein